MVFGFFFSDESELAWGDSCVPPRDYAYISSNILSTFLLLYLCLDCGLYHALAALEDSAGVYIEGMEQQLHCFVFTEDALFQAGTTRIYSILP